MFKSSSWVLTIIVLGLIGGILAPKLLGLTGHAPVPPAFAESVSLTQAVEQSSQSGKLVLALVTAEWCGPCQMLKRGALTDDRVTAWIQQNAVAVYIETTDNDDDSKALPVRVLPTSVLIRDGKIVSSLEGNASAEKYLAWLKANAAESLAVTPTDG